MNTKLNCPVCGYQEIESETCPNCDTDLSLIRTLQELAPVEKTSLEKKNNNLTLLLAVLMLIVGIGLGISGSFLIIKHQHYGNIVIPSSNAIHNPATLTNTPRENIYIVKQGDNLGLIAEKVCGKASNWKLIAKANPHLENRRNYFISVGEKLQIPHCQQKNQ
jgi:nucleoid-associated protein YgaU